MELIPLHALGEDVPTHFREAYFHWLDVLDSSIELRPFSDRWTPSQDNWRMVKGIGESYSLRKGPQTLIDRYSRTADLVLKCLSPIEEGQYIHIFLNPALKKVEIDLQRLDLSFCKDFGCSRLESNQFRGMIVDENQSIGTLSGLRSKLVLHGENDRKRRSVLIPFGDVDFKQCGDHVDVQLRSAETSVNYFRYHVDEELDRLIDVAGTLISRFFRCYLHALTSHHLVDRLTKNTGIEQALGILKSQGSRSFQTLSALEIQILGKLADLTPRRRFYPEHLKVMQTVRWKTLPPTSQHPQLLTLVKDLVAQSTNASEAFDQPIAAYLQNLDDEAQIYLSDRAALRDSTFYVHGFGGEAHTIIHDKVYDARDRKTETQRELRAHKIARLTNDWSTQECYTSLLHELENWQQPLQGSRDETMSLGYDLHWLDPYKYFMPSMWFKFAATFSKSYQQRDQYRIMFFLATLAFSEHADMNLLQTLLAFATSPQLRDFRTPSEDVYRLSEGSTCEKSVLRQILEDHTRSIAQSEEGSLPFLAGENLNALMDRRESSYRNAVNDETDIFVNNLTKQWPCSKPVSPLDLSSYQHIDLRGAMFDISTKFHTWFQNLELLRRLEEVQTILNGFDHHLDDKYPYSPCDARPVSIRRREIIDLTSVFQNAAPLVQRPDQNLEKLVKTSEEERSTTTGLTLLLQRLRNEASNQYEQQYAEALQNSVEALARSQRTNMAVDLEAWSDACAQESYECNRDFELAKEKVFACLSKQGTTTRLLASRIGMGPRLNIPLLLACLANLYRMNLAPEWQEALVSFGSILKAKQRVTRLLRYNTSDPALLSELRSSNPGHWDPHRFPGWMVLEIENNICIRPEQIRTAEAIMSPATKSNSVLQLNMGEGKSSVIVPMVAWALADQQQLVRVMVLRPLSQQMFDLLVSKISGFLNRRIWSIPISRHLRMTPDKAQSIQNMYKTCALTGGILLVQPEHARSFELMCIEKSLENCRESRRILIETQLWLNKNARDILDESDEILSVRSELVYTMGVQRPIDLSPERWLLIQDLLRLASKVFNDLQADCPHALQVEYKSRSRFPEIRILNEDAAPEIIEKLAEHISRDGLRGVPVWSMSPANRQRLRTYISTAGIGTDATRSIHSHFNDQALRQKLLLLKGLLGSGVLAFTFFKKRWRVNYGLFSDRTMLAVPYSAKDVPAPRADFSHPDVTIVLTCLSYYYGGLTDEQLMSAFERLKSSSNAQQEYDTWGRDSQGLPSTLHHLDNVNLADVGLCEQVIFPALRYAKAVVDFFLAQIVFPTAMREFPKRLSSSGWDTAKEKGRVMTGFSGTNDSRAVLPLSVTQEDLSSQVSTNARVLEWLLRPNNSFRAISNTSTSSPRFTAQTLLDSINQSQPPIRVIIDVGAQVLDWQNEEVARRWLDSVKDQVIQAVVFFNHLDELSILTREGAINKFPTSPYSEQLDRCLVYLDEAHTRGTDLRLPRDCVAAVTLGPGLTKDRLVQGLSTLSKYYLDFADMI